MSATAASSRPPPVRWIQALYSTGLSKLIVGLLPCVHNGIATPDMVARLVAGRERVQAQIRGLSETRDRLDQVIAVARDSGPVAPPVTAGMA